MDVREAVEKRRSIRKFLDKDVPPDFVIELIDSARQAPSSGNLQSWKFILVKNQEIKNQVADACFQQNWLSRAPVLVVVVAFIEGVSRYYGVRGEMLYSVQNCALASQNIMLRAVELGLSTTMVSAFDEGMIKRCLGIPESMRPQAVIAVGYGDETPRKKLLSSIESLVYFEKFGARVESWDEAFYEWSGIMKDKARYILNKVKKAGTALRERVQERAKY
jgi:nitroreductase